MKKQLSLLPKVAKSHGGSLAVGKRRACRPLNTKQSHHITLKSHHAVGGRCLYKHKKMINAVIAKSAKHLEVKVYERAICSNHIHLLIKGADRVRIQNFFRVVAGHTAQNILKLHPLPKLHQQPICPSGGKRTSEDVEGERMGGAPVEGVIFTPGGAPVRAPKGCRKNQRKFWSYLIFSRIVSWGREFKTVSQYVQKNTLEALNLIAYQPRHRRACKRRRQMTYPLRNKISYGISKNRMRNSAKSLDSS